MRPRHTELLERLTKLSSLLEPHRSDAAFDRAALESQWLQDELVAGRLELPLKDTNEVFLAYAMSEGLLDSQPEVLPVAEEVLDLILEPW